MSTIQNKKVVQLNYTLTDDQGEFLDQSEPGAPLVYLHGVGELVDGLEKELTGCSVGDKLNVTVDPVSGYGEIDEALTLTFERDKLPEGPELEVGMQIATDFGDGSYQMFWVQEITETQIMVDGNHPLAGRTLTFDVEVMGIRDATEEEIAHGHVHGEGGHHH